MVQLKKEDFGADDIFAGMRFQREIERRAYAAAGGGYRAPIQLYKDFASDRNSSGFGEVIPSYACGTAFVPICEVLPFKAVEALKAAIPDMDRKLRGVNRRGNAVFFALADCKGGERRKRFSFRSLSVWGRKRLFGRNNKLRRRRLTHSGKNIRKIQKSLNYHILYTFKRYYILTKQTHTLKFFHMLLLS